MTRQCRWLSSGSGSDGVGAHGCGDEYAADVATQHPTCRQLRWNSQSTRPPGAWLGCGCVPGDGAADSSATTRQFPVLVGQRDSTRFGADCHRDVEAMAR